MVTRHKEIFDVDHDEYIFWFRWNHFDFPFEREAVCNDMVSGLQLNFHEFSQESHFQPLAGANPIDARQLFYLDDEQFRARFRKTPLWRAKRRGLVRNAAIVLGNQPDIENLPALACGLHDQEPLIRGAAAWAIGQHRHSQATFELLKRLEVEQDPYVIEECRDALTSIKKGTQTADGAPGG